jgi:MinD-like ATPase involved in chromosome partitioning or flagellar assembly
MISPVLVFALLAGVPQANLNQARQSYSGCLSSLLRTNLKDRVATDAFETNLANACKVEETAYRTAAVSIDMASGTSRATAEQGATFEITDIVENTKQRYKDYLETNTEPQ